MIDPDHLPLQPLRIPMGWTVCYNNAFYEIERITREITNGETA